MNSVKDNCKTITSPKPIRPNLKLKKPDIQIVEESCDSTHSKKFSPPKPSTMLDEPSEEMFEEPSEAIN